ncbi:MAG: hypothetical protein VX433_02070 [Candidatus Thermoplasmatota archaeon]|nr:hypothetical protein [Candidatus Thermoplasmatota archaeon]
MRVQDRVRAQFNWALDQDIHVAHRLSQRITTESSNRQMWTVSGREQSLESLIDRLEEGPVATVGAAAEPAEVEIALSEGYRLVFADGSIGVIGELSADYQDKAWSDTLLLVSDGDGDPHIDEAAQRGILHAIHAHGDNEESLISMIDRLIALEMPPAVLLTHQTPDRIEGMLNPGGFTDGDRAVCLCAFLGVPVETIRLIGYTTSEIGRWTGNTDPIRKMRKLTFMQEVLDGLGVGG